MSENFECAWESAGEVPLVTIDFPGGERLKRTLGGNVATWLCTPEGGAFELVAGIVEPDAYLLRLARARAFHTGLDEAPDARAAVAERNGRLYAELATNLSSYTFGAPAAQPRLAVSKMMVEGPIKLALADELRLTLSEEEIRFWEGTRELVPRPPEALQVDTLRNRAARDAPAALLLSQNPLAPPAQLTRRVYREILHLDLDDPYLGLAPLALGGEVGRESAPGG